MSHPHPTAQAHHAASSTEDIPWLFLDNRVYRRLGEVTIRHSGGTTRVNHVVVSNYGIFVIDENSETGSFQASSGMNWTEYKDEHSLEIPNPVRQIANQAHALQEALGLPGSHFNTAVFFTGAGVYLKGEVPDNVISEGFTDYVKSFKKVILSDAQVEEIVTKIKSLGALPKPSHQPHPQHPHAHAHAHPHPPGHAHGRHAEPEHHRPAPRPAPNQTKNILYGLAALLLGALITSLIVTWLS